MMPRVPPTDRANFAKHNLTPTGFTTRRVESQEAHPFYLLPMAQAIPSAIEARGVAPNGPNRLAQMMTGLGTVTPWSNP